MKDLQCEKGEKDDEYVILLRDFFLYKVSQIKAQ